MHLTSVMVQHFPKAMGALCTMHNVIPDSYLKRSWLNPGIQVSHLRNDGKCSTLPQDCVDDQLC